MSSWVDVSIIHSILTGGILLVFGFWAWLLYIHLWREYLLHSCAEAINFCEQQGFMLVSSDLRSEIRMKKDNIRIYWKGGWRGEETFLEKEGNIQKQPLLQSEEDISSLIDPVDPISKLQSE